jgi:hypothetical protein
MCASAFDPPPPRDALTDMLAGRHPYIANDESWGFADEHFEEQVM